MRKLPEIALQNTTLLAPLVSVLQGGIEGIAGAQASFQRLEQLALELTNEAVRQVLEQDLERRATNYPPEVLIEQVRYRQHEPGEVTYHSLCGPLVVTRYSYRPVGVRNGRTVIPLELEAGLIQGATPELAYNVSLGYAKHDMRSHHEDLVAAHRIPPSRSTLERMAKNIGQQVKAELVHIEPVVREQERVCDEARGLTLGLDRTSVPMEEERAVGQAPKTRRKKRTKPYQRRAPPPVDVNWRMAYVGTVTLHDAQGQELVSRRYTALPNEEIQGLVGRMMADVREYLKQRPQLNVAVVQDGAPELWGGIRTGLEAEEVVKEWDEAIDRYHLQERLGKAVGLLPLSPQERQGLLEAWAKRLDEDDAAIDGIERTLRVWYGKLDETEACRLWEHLVYLRNNKNRMRYASLLGKGLPVGSGVTEAACKSVIGQRTAGSGQRWHEEGLDAALTLRAIHRSERLPRLWEQFAHRHTKAVGMPDP